MSGIYVHIPFCGKRCNYCDFYLITNLELIEKFLLNLKKEISILSDIYKTENFETLYFGGGTPSVLSANQYSDLINAFAKNFNLSADSEISIESNPEDFLQKKLPDYKSAGVNRISFGAQSFLDDELKFLTRQHTSAEAEKVICDALKYFDNVNIDIIYSLPSQKNSGIEFSLSKAIDLGASHISAYTLTFEEKTLLYKALKNNFVKKNPEEREAELYEFVSHKLISSGFEHYEISNFAKPGYKCSHNLKYWNYQNYIGLGPSAHSFYNNSRWNNFRDIKKYNSELQINRLPVENKIELTREQSKLEFIMLSLRSEGLDFRKYERLFGEDFEIKFSNVIKGLIKNNFAFNENGKLSLNEKGYVVADGIIAGFIR